MDEFSLPETNRQEPETIFWFILNVVINSISAFFTAVFWILSLPITATTWTMNRIRARRYDPEKLVCPACGFRGDSGTGGKSCTVSFIRVLESQKGVLRHTCFRCGCNEIYSGLFLSANKWLPAQEQSHLAVMKKAAEREVI